jgi:hypothetical protein
MIKERRKTNKREDVVSALQAVLQVRTFLVGSGSGRLGPDPDPGLDK